MASPSWYPRSNLYPRSTLYPSPRDEILETFPHSALFPSNFFYPATRQIRVVVNRPRSSSGPVGHPRIGLRPLRGHYPGPLVQITYRRIHYPGATVFPNAGLYPFQEAPDYLRSIRGQVTTLESRGGFVMRLGTRARSGLSTLFGRSLFNSLGVESSAPAGSVTTKVEFSTIRSQAEFLGSPVRAEFQSLPLRVEIR